MSCKTQQSSKQKTTVIATDTTTITQVTEQDSVSIIARIDSIIIEEYTADDQSEQTTEDHNNTDSNIRSCQKRNDTSLNKFRSIKKITKIYGVSLSGSWFSENDSLKKKMGHQEKTNQQIKQKTPLLNNAGSRIVFAIIVFVITILVGYLIWKFAVQ